MKTKRKFIPKDWNKEFLLCSPNDLKFLFLQVYQELLEKYKMENPDIAHVFTFTNPVWNIESEINRKMCELDMQYTKKQRKSWGNYVREILKLYADTALPEVNDPK